MNTRRLYAAVACLVLAGCNQLSFAFPTDTPADLPTPEIPTAAPGPTSTLPNASPTSAVDAALEAELDDERNTVGAPGAMAVVLHGGQEISLSSGAADEAGTPITDETRFRIASNTKPITAALVLGEVAAGSLSLDDEVNGLLPGVLRPQQPVTIRQLLSHTSGIFDEINQPDIFADIPQLPDETEQAEARNIQTGYETDERTIMPDRLIVALSETHDRYFAPGDGYHYSNTNYQLAGMILEKTSGMSLADLLQAKIVGPLGLTHTTLLPPDTASPEFRGYVRRSTDGSLIDVTDDLLIFGNGGPGGIITTAGELLTMIRAIVSGQVLPADLVTEMEQPIRNNYGLGISPYRLSCGDFLGHEGLTNGTQSIVLVSRTGRDGVAIAINLRSDSDTHLADLADKMVCARGPS